jgi:D-alanyl-D-alanine carboxypeptidase
VAAAKLVLLQSARFEFKREPLYLCPASSLSPRHFLVSTHPNSLPKKRAQRLGVDGVTLTLEICVNRFSAPLLPNTQLQGLPYSDDAKFVLKVSYNIGADTSLVLYGLTQGVDDIDSALTVEQTNLQNNYGITPAEYHFLDGSGGGETTAVCPAVTRFLKEMVTRPAFPQYLAGFPIMGVDGSLVGVKHFLSNPTLAGAKGNVLAKPGTFVDAPDIKGQAFAGYIHSKSGRTLVYEVVVNNVPFTSIQDILNIFDDQGTVSVIIWRDY